MAWFPLALVGALRVTLFGIMLLFVFPRLILPARPAWDAADRWAASGMMGLLLLEVVGHILVPLQLYELLGFSLVMICLVLFLRYKRGGMEAVMAVLKVPLYRLLLLIDRFGAAAAEHKAALRAPQLPRVSRIAWSEAAGSLLAAGTAVVAVGSRLTFALSNGAPAPSDYLEHLQWSRWLILPEHRLMEDVIYPRGMNMLHAAFRFLTQEELHVIAKVAGPLLNLLTIAAIWYVVRALTGSRMGALVAAALYAGAPAWLPVDWGRQATPLPQEFAMALILPAAWWGYRYLQHRDKLDLLLAAGAALVVAATHWIVLIYVALIFIVVTVSRLDRFRDTVVLGVAVAGATAAGMVPQIVAFLMGVRMLGTAAEFATGEATQLVIPIGPGAGLLILVTLLTGLLGTRKEPARRILPGFLLGSLLVYALPYLGLSSPAIATRSWDFLALAIAGAVGASFAALERLAGARLTPGVVAGVALTLVALLWVTSPPRVLSMEPELPEEYTMQIMRLRREMEPGQWAAVGRPDQVALVLTSGSQYDASRFTQAIPEPPGPGRHVADAMIGGGLVPANVHRTQVPDLLIFVESSPYLSAAAKASGRDRLIMAEHDAMAVWMERYLQGHPDTEIFYRSPTLTIYFLPAPLQ